MNELSHRLSLAIDFIKRNGYAHTDAEIAKKIGCRASALNMAKTGARVPGWGLLLDFCDAYPVNFWWLRAGDGGMLKGERELALLKRIEELEREIQELKR